MAGFTCRSVFVGLAVVLSALVSAANAQLSPDFYSTSCPTLESIVRTEMASAVDTEKRMAASILRMFFHDCFVNGCDGSILLDNGGEKSAPPNLSVRGYGVIDTIKSKVEAVCNGTVSCADILALAARDGVNLVGGPAWNVSLGRKDSRSAMGNTGDLPSPDSSLAMLNLKFVAKNLSATDMTALSGAHTIGRSQCQFFRNRIYNKNEKNIDRNFARQLRQTCPPDDSLTNFDAQTADGDVFDNGYYKNLVIKKGLLHSDQELFTFNGGSQDALVDTYRNNMNRFFSDFVTAMVKMGNLLPLPGTEGEIRSNCRAPNPKTTN